MQCIIQNHFILYYDLSCLALRVLKPVKNLVEWNASARRMNVKVSRTKYIL